MKNSTGTAWTALTGATPKTTAVTVGIDVKTSNGKTVVRYTVDGVALKAGTTEWHEIVALTRTPGAFALTGTSSLASLSATCTDVAMTYALTLPAIDNVAVDSVTCADIEIAAGADSSYAVPAGAQATVTFKAAEGYVLTTRQMTFVVDANATLPAARRPSTVGAASLVINEVMAKNSATRATGDGFRAIDWVEIRNTGDADVDLAGWYLSNDPTKRRRTSGRSSAAPASFPHTATS